MRPGTGLYSFISQDWGSVEEKTKERERSAEIGRRWKRGNGTRGETKSGCGGEEDKAKVGKEENGIGEMEWKSKLNVREGWREH